MATLNICLYLFSIGGTLGLTFFEKTVKFIGWKTSIWLSLFIMGVVNIGLAFNTNIYIAFCLFFLQGYFFQ
jgi:hypothetical protein